MDELPTLDDMENKQKSVLLRLDINAPIVNSTILDTTSPEFWEEKWNISTRSSAEEFWTG
ncbi:MAG: hypothetical protein PWQ22_743 [Archaeoglobaceae archaeon]|nr:hypothetical protein [Archaeoglobaceae archaeon]